MYINYRGKILTSHTMKMLVKVIEIRIRKDCEITQNAFGFMPSRGTSDATFALRQLQEKRACKEKPTYGVC